MRETGEWPYLDSWIRYINAARVRARTRKRWEREHGTRWEQRPKLLTEEMLFSTHEKEIVRRWQEMPKGLEALLGAQGER